MGVSEKQPARQVLLNYTDRTETVAAEEEDLAAASDIMVRFLTGTRKLYDPATSLHQPSARFF